MTQEELQAIRERCGKATEGPWSFDPGDYYQLDNGSEYVISAEMYGNYAGLGYNEWDADFISHSRDDVPHLLDEIERQAKEIAQLKIVIEQNPTYRCMCGYRSSYELTNCPECECQGHFKLVTPSEESCVIEMQEEIERLRGVLAEINEMDSLDAIWHRVSLALEGDV